MRLVVLLLLVACSEKKRDEPPPPPPKPAGPPPACVEFEKLLDHLEQCADKEVSSYPDILMAKSSLRMNRDGDPVRRAAFCAERILDFRASFPRCVTAEARGSAPPPPLEPVPLEPSVLGKTPGPFGRLAFLRAGITRDQILDELGIRHGRGPSIPVDVGIYGFEDTQIDIDFADTLDIVKIRNTPSNLRAVLIAAWGEPARGSTWFDTAKGWRVDLTTSFMIGPYVPFASIVGEGPDGLPDNTTLFGLTHTQVRARYGARFNGSEILMPATDVCAYYTKLFVDFDARTNLVTKLRLAQCYDSAESAKAVVDAMTRAWGTPTPTKPNGMTFARAGRTIDVRFDARITATITVSAER